MKGLRKSATVVHVQPRPLQVVVLIMVSTFAEWETSNKHVTLNKVALLINFCKGIAFLSLSISLIPASLPPSILHPLIYQLILNPTKAFQLFLRGHSVKQLAS